MMITHRPWTKKELKSVIDLHARQGSKLPASAVLEETSMFGPEIKPERGIPVCLNHPKRTCFAQVDIDADLNIVGVK